MKTSLPILLALGVFLVTGVPMRAAEMVVLAKDGKARLPIVLAPDSGEKMLSLANELKGHLDRITGGNFQVVPELQKPAIVLGTRTQFPDLLSEPVKGEAPTWRERYRLVAQKGSLYLIGETDLAVQNAVFDLLDTLGYRQFFPHPAWEIVPKIPGLSIAVDRIGEPGYSARTLFYGTVSDRKLSRIFRYSKIVSAMGQWRRKNRGQSMSVNTGHVWHRMASRYAGEFAAHPEWISGKQTKPWTAPDIKDWKFRVENEELRKLLRQDIADTFDANPETMTYSIDPTDGVGWPEDSPIGTPSDQMVYLANDLVASIKDKHPDKKIAFYAYHMHSPPPSLKLDGSAIVNVATGFIRGGYTVGQLLKGWKDKGAELGIRDYINVFFGSWDLPGNQNYLGFSPDHAHDYLAQYHKDGARYWIAETDSAWGAIGLGTYVAFRTLWNPVNGPSVQELREDFLTKSFGPVAKTVRPFFEAIDPKNKPLLSSDLMGRMYDPLLAALKANPEPAAKVRVQQLLSYTRFAELMYQYRNATGPERVEAFRELGEWALRYRDDQMFSSIGIFQTIGFREDDLKATAEDLLENEARFQPLSDGDLVQLATDRARQSLRMTFTPVVFSNTLVRGDFPSKSGQKVYELSRIQTLLWLADKPGSELELTIRGLGGRPASPPPISVKITHVDDVLDEPSDSQEVVPDGEWHTAKLRAAMAGLHRVAILDPSNYLEIQWPSGTPIVFPFGQVLHGMPRTKGVPYSGWIYVPVKADHIAGYSEAPGGKILSDAGQVVHDFTRAKGTNYFDARITPSDKPRVFKLENLTGKIMLMTTPPYMARSPEELLIPSIN